MRGSVETERILIVEDDADVGLVLEELLADAGYDTRLAATLAAAHRALAEVRIDLVLCDLMLPDGDAEMDLRTHAPCLFMAGHPEAMLRLQHEGSHYIAKPFTMEQLLTAIRDCLDRGRCSSPAGEL